MADAIKLTKRKEGRKKASIEINEEFKKALRLLESSSKNVFITGKAGTGKSTLLSYFRERSKKKVAVLAPTGVAAVNVRGETIHSFFRFRPDITVKKVKRISSKKKTQLYRKMDMIIIDEISMVRADLLDCVDKFLRLNGRKSDEPFGGIQMAFFGDLYQLPPVVTSKEKHIFDSFYKSSYFFDSKVFQNFEMEFIELIKIYRQKDENFIKLLNGIRNNTVSEQQIKILNQRLDAHPEIENLDYCVYLTPRNKLAAEINHTQLSRLKQKLHVYEGEIRGEFEEKYLPTDYELRIKKGSQVMLLNNDEYGRWVNGTIARVIRIENAKEKYDTIYVRLPEGNIEPVGPFKWELFHYQLNDDSGELETEVAGYFRQYPIKLAWAVTIHKSQGKTFDRVILDISGGIFACGQIYVALSRCTTLEGITLRKAIEKKHIFTDWKIIEFITKYQYKISEKELPLEEKINIIRKAIDEDSLLEIIYLKTNDEKSKRVIKPLNVGEMSYLNRTFTGIEAYCHQRKEVRNFRVDRILELKPV